MGRAAIDADDEARPTDQPNELENGRVVQQIETVFRWEDLPVCTPNEDNASGCERAAKFFHRQIAERLAAAAGKWMKENESFLFLETRDSVAGWQRKTERPRDWDPEEFDQLEIALDRVRIAIDRCDLLIEEVCAFPGIAHPAKLARMTDAANQCAPQQTLKIERDIGLEPARLLQPGKEMIRHPKTPKLTSGKNMDVIDTPVAAQQRRPFGVDHPGDLRCGICLSNQGGRGQGMDNVPERTRLDDENGRNAGLHNLMPTV